jgi:hypothetical protein
MSRTVRLLFIGAAFFLFSAAQMPAQDQTPELAQKIVDAAVLKAKAENKAVFIHYSASW